MQALITLTPAESKRLIAKGIVTQPEIINAKQGGYLLVGRGSTNAYILEELLGEPVAKERYCAGQVIKGFLCVLGAGERIQPVTFHRGEVLRVDPAEVLDKLTPGDILLKGANALDPDGNVGVFMANASRRYDGAILPLHESPRATYHLPGRAGEAGSFSPLIIRFRRYPDANGYRSLCGDGVRT